MALKAPQNNEKIDAVATLNHVLKHAECDAKTQNIKKWPPSVLHAHPAEKWMEKCDTQRDTNTHKDRQTDPPTYSSSQTVRDKETNQQSAKKRHINYN